MEFLIADTFTDSLGRLTGDEQKAVKTTAFDLQLNPANPGMRFHKLDKAKDKKFWSVRVSRDIRIIVHRSESSLLLCYVGHHDTAYGWAERRKLATHPKTGAAQIVEIRETVQEIVRPIVIDETVARPSVTPGEKKPLFSSLSDEELLTYGVPAEWLNDVRRATEDTVLELAERLPAEAAEAFLELAVGTQPKPATAVESANPFEHPDALRRFRVMTNVEELQRALDFPWDKWTVFLHPEQRQIVEVEASGPMRVSGSAGTGKTVVALHRAVHLARRNPDARILLTTFSHILANSLRTHLNRLISNDPRLAERIEVHSINAIGTRLLKAHGIAVRLAPRETVRNLIRKSAGEQDGHQFSPAFLLSEWDHVLDAWQLNSWDDYRDFKRLGRKTRLSEPRRMQVWQIAERVRSSLAEAGLTTIPGMFARLTSLLAEKFASPFDHVVVDEAQDMEVAHLRFFAALGSGRPEALFFTGDLGQRIFQQPFSWLAQGVDIRGRSKRLRVNYRTSHQIRSQADRLLDPRITDADGQTEDRDDTVSVFNGPAPEIRTFKTPSDESLAVGQWLKQRLDEGLHPHECAVFVRSETQLDRASAALDHAGAEFKLLDEEMEGFGGKIAVGTMHLAKGLEFRAVAVMACDDEIIPLQERIETVGDEGDLKEVYETERHLLYVACTRARDHLLITATSPASEFPDDLRAHS